MALSIAARPADDDTVLETPVGAKVFLAVSVVYDLHEQQLDVESERSPAAPSTRRASGDQSFRSDAGVSVTRMRSIDGCRTRSTINA